MSNYLTHLNMLIHPLLAVIIIVIKWVSDVSELLFRKGYSCDNVQSINSSVSSILLPKWTCNIINYTIFDFSRFTLIESIDISDHSFGSVQTFQIDGLNRLKCLEIGKNSFTQEKNDWGNDKSKSFHILNCESLESIQIDEYSFSDFGGDFELKNLPQLQSIQIGSIEKWSYNFCYCSFVIRGIDMISNIWMMHRSSKSTIHYIRWLCILLFLLNHNGKYWMNSNEMIDVDLPSLQSIQLGEGALAGRSWDDSSSLIMRSNNELIWNDLFCRSSKSNINNFWTI